MKYLSVQTADGPGGPFVLQHQETGTAAEGPLGRLRARWIAVGKPLGPGSAGVSPGAGVHVLGFPLVAGCLCSQPWAPLLFSFALRRRTTASEF